MANSSLKENLIAPCGMNCRICSGYLALENDLKSKGIRKSYCSGCRPRDKTCAFLKKRCQLLMNHRVKFCFECPDFPCHELKSIDNRYRTRYHMSLIGNLQYIRDQGMERFLQRENEKWRCPNCDSFICCHNGICLHCELDKLKKKKKRYSWSDE